MTSKKTSLVDIIIPTRNNWAFLNRCVNSLRRQSFRGFRVIIVDNGSDQETIASVTFNYPDVELISVGYNAFFCEGINIGLSRSCSQFVAVVNDDTEFSETWLQEALQTFEQFKDIGSVASKIFSLRNKNVIDSAGDHLLPDGVAGNIGWGQPDQPQFSHFDTVFSACAAGAVYRRSALDAVGRFDETLVAYYDDVDVGFRLQLHGYPCVFNPRAIMYHYGSSSPKNTIRTLSLVERNILVNLLKNMPSKLLCRHRGSILKAALKPLYINQQRKIEPWIFGKTSFLLKAKQLLPIRKKIQLQNIVSTDYIDSLLTKRDTIDCHL